MAMERDDVGFELISIYVLLVFVNVRMRLCMDSLHGRRRCYGDLFLEAFVSVYRTYIDVS